MPAQVPLASADEWPGCRDVLLRWYWRRLCRIRRWQRPGLCRWQTGEVGRALRIPAAAAGAVVGAGACVAGVSDVGCRVSAPSAGAGGGEVPWAELHRLRRRMRPDPRGGQMREIRYTRRMAGYWCRRGRTGGGLRCRGCRRRRLASSRGGRLRSWRCCWRFLRGLRHEVDARCRSECREIWPGRRTRRSRGYGFGLSGGRGYRQHRRHGAAGSGRPYTPRHRRCRC